MSSNSVVKRRQTTCMRYVILAPRWAWTDEFWRISIPSPVLRRPAGSKRNAGLHPAESMECGIARISRRGLWQTPTDVALFHQHFPHGLQALAIGDPEAAQTVAAMRQLTEAIAARGTRSPPTKKYLSFGVRSIYIIDCICLLSLHQLAKISARKSMLMKADFMKHAT